MFHLCYLLILRWIYYKEEIKTKMSIFSNRSSSSTRKSDDTMNDDTDDKDDTKRKSRNLSEKKRRDQFNLLINELSSMVSTNGRKMDKSTVLKSTIAFLKNHNDITARSRSSEIQEDWKPSFLSNEEFTHLFLEAIDGFIISFSAPGCVLYVSESITSLLGHLPSKILGSLIYELVHESDHSTLYNILLGSSPDILYKTDKEAEVSFVCHFKRDLMQPPQAQDEPIYEIVQFIGFLKYDAEVSQVEKNCVNRYTGYPEDGDARLIFVGTGRLQRPQLIREVLIMDSTKSEFTSRHSLEWKFLFLDHRAPPIIGYLPFEVLGTSGYDYYHVDDLDKVVTCHEALMEKGEGTSCYYRFLTKGQQWIWLQTRFYITYHQWNSKPEFIVCTHRVVSYFNLLKQNGCEIPEIEHRRPSTHGSSSKSWSSKSVSKTQKSVKADLSSITADSSLPHLSHISSKSMRLESSNVGRTSSIKGECSVRGETAQSVSPTLEISSSYSHNQGQQLPSYPSHHIIPQVQQALEVNQLERKHEELQQLIVEQQAELRRLSEQLLMARYGLLPSIINVSMPYAVGQPAGGQQSAPSPDMYINPNTLPVSPVILDPHQVAPTSGEGYHIAHTSQQSDLVYSNNSIASSSSQHKH